MAQNQGQGQQVQGQVQVPPIQIVISPWHADIDPSTKAGMSLWAEGIKPLETKFSGYGKDIVQFLASVRNRVDKCLWHGIVTFGNRTLLSNHGEVAVNDVITARDTRDAVVPNTLQEARPKLNALMLFHFIYDSLGTLPQKKISTRLDQIRQDGPLLLKFVLDDTFVASQASTFTIKEKFYDLNLKKYKGNVQSLNQDVREKQVDLIAAGHESDQTDIIISLFRAYATSTNTDFLSAVSHWRNEWNSRVWTTPEELMRKADAKYSELKDLGTWGKRIKDDQYVALSARIDELKKSQEGSSQKQDKESSGPSTRTNAPKWKYDRSLSNKDTYERNGKTYHWCKGPGHNGIGMWVIHEPGTCTKTQPDNKKSGSQSNTLDKKALTAALKAKDLNDEEVESKVEAILAVIQS